MPYLRNMEMPRRPKTRDVKQSKPRNKIMTEEKEEKKKQSVGSAIVSLIVIAGVVYALYILYS